MARDGLAQPAPAAADCGRPPVSDLDRDNLARAASRMAVLVKVSERISQICTDVAHHYRDAVEPNGFKAMLVTFDQECCLLYKAELDKHLPPEASEIVISVSKKDERYKPYDRDRDEEEKLLDRFRDPNDPLKILVVTAKLLTGFDAPILQAMYLDKPLRDHTLLQAICRTSPFFSAGDWWRKAQSGRREPRSRERDVSARALSNLQSWKKKRAVSRPWLRKAVKPDARL